LKTIGKAVLATIWPHQWNTQQKRLLIHRYQFIWKISNYMEWYAYIGLESSPLYQTKPTKSQKSLEDRSYIFDFCLLINLQVEYILIENICFLSKWKNGWTRSQPRTWRKEGLTVSWELRDCTLDVERIKRPWKKKYRTYVEVAVRYWDPDLETFFGQKLL
jgi:hypothetical protein